MVFISNVRALKLQNRQLGREDGCIVGVRKSSWHPQAQDEACEDRPKLMLVLVASNLDCMCLLQKPDPFIAIAKHTPCPAVGEV